jgi:hypothetical protein
MLDSGDLCSVQLAEGDYRVVKILALRDGIAHLRLYADRFAERPFAVDPTELGRGGIHESFGIPHLPLNAEDFATWRPGHVGHEEVRADELSAYLRWREHHERSLLRGRT